MFKIESYITPIILNHVAKYVKNIRPQDAQLSLWEGEVQFQNLDLRLDVLEEELNLPFEFLSGHIHELSIHVPWTKITSEPIRIVINTIEFVLKLKDEQADGAGSSASSSPQRSRSVPPKPKRSSKLEEQHPPQQSAVMGLVNKIINNIVLECHNIILKYVEEDIVVSMNVQLLSVSSADERWRPAMADLHPVRVLMRKLVQISDLTICLDKRNDAGQIDVCQEPILYRCTLECRILRKYNATTAATTSITRVGVYTKSLDVNVSSLQFPMVMRVVRLIMTLKSGKFKSTSAAEPTEEELEEQESTRQVDESYLTWAWNLLPSFNFQSLEEEVQADAEQPGHTLDLGVYVQTFNFTLKISEFVNDSIMGTSKRIRYTPIACVKVGGMYFEIISAEERNWSSVKAGLSSICLEPLGPYRCDDKTMQALIVTTPLDNLLPFIDKSLFDEQYLIADRGWGVSNYEEYMTHITDEYLLFRSPILAFDMIEYKPPPKSEGESGKSSSTEVGDSDTRQQYRLLSSGITFRYCQTLLQVKHVISELVDTYDYPAYYAEQIDTTAKAAAINTPKLHPPLMEDYDALMQHIPLRTYKFLLRDIGLAIYPKTEPDAIVTAGGQRTQTRMLLSPRQLLPYFLLHFDLAQGIWSTPLEPDKLVHTTCQLPDKPTQLLHACYDNYKCQLQNFSFSLNGGKTPNGKQSIKLLLIPNLLLAFGKLLQPQHWKDEEVPVCRLDVGCEQLFLDFSSCDVSNAHRLLNCVFSYQPHQFVLVANQLCAYDLQQDAARLQSVLQRLQLRMKRYTLYTIWNVCLRGLTTEVVRNHEYGDDSQIVFRSVTNVHNNRHKWLELQVQIPADTDIDTTDNPTNRKGKGKVKELVLVTAVALWVERFYISLDANILEFFKYREQWDPYFERETIIEIELHTQTLQPQLSASTVLSAPQLPSISQSLSSSAFGPNPLQRRSSRQSLPTRRVSHPEETVHFSSERDEKPEPNAPHSPPHPPKKERPPGSWLPFVKALVVHMEVAHGEVAVAEVLLRNAEMQIACEHTQIVLPKIVLKSSHSEEFMRSNMLHKICVPVADNLNWTIALHDLAMHNRHPDTTGENILGPTQTSITIALSHTKEMKGTHGTSIDMLALKQPAKSRYNADEISIMRSELELPKSVAKTESTEPSMWEDRSDERQYTKRGPYRMQDIVTLNLHADTTPIRIFISTRKIKTLHQNLSVLMRVLQLLEPMTQASGTTGAAPLKILTATEEDANIKEFLEMETTSHTSHVSDEEAVPSITVTLFCQWTITKIIIELQNMETAHKSKVMLELEDLLSTVDKRDDYTKYTSKMGNFSLNYYKRIEKGEWQAQEYLRIKMLGESTSLPFFNVIITSVGLRSFYQRIGARRKGVLNRKLSEILITMQAVEVIANLDRMIDFLAPLCALFASDSKIVETNAETSRSAQLHTACDLPLIHFDSKGFALYLPLDMKMKCCSVLIWKIESIKITPNLDNPLQRNPLRVDVYSKAAQLGMLGIPGSLVEDRQYELTLGNISAATGNWEQILARRRDQVNSFHRTNPAFEWNNQNHKPSLQLVDIFSQFKFMAIFAPCIVYNNILICGQAMEFNCAADFIASLNMYQLNLLSCVLVHLGGISDLIQNTCQKAEPLKCQSLFTLSSDDSKSNSITYQPRISRSLYSLHSSKQSFPSTRRSVASYFDARGSSVFDSIDEDTEQNVKTDSGFQSCVSRSYLSSRHRFAAFTGNSAIPPDRLDNQQTAIERHVPQTLSLVAGIFILKFFAFEDTEESEEQGVDVPLISCTISQPSFMITQNVHDCITQVSLFNLSVHMSSKEEDPLWGNSNKFPEVLIDTRPGELGASGIPPPLFSLKAHRTKMQLLEVDAELLKSIVVELSEQNALCLCGHLLRIYEAMLDNPCLFERAEQPVTRGTKIGLLKKKCFQADHLHFKCHRIVMRFFNEGNYSVKLVAADMRLNVKFLARPEKATVKMSFGAFYLNTKNKIFLHPVALRASVDLVSEPWHSLPLITGTLKFNVVHTDVGIYSLVQLQRALQGYNRVVANTTREYLQFMRKHRTLSANAVVIGQLQPLKCPSLGQVVVKANAKRGAGKSKLHREEFYQDDLRAGAFQFVELMTDSFLPLPYQIQIIKKNFGIICWRYPQPRKMCNIHIFPVPMAVSNPVHIKCRMEYFSEPHESFLHYCDFWLSETVSKPIALPELEVCATIWRVVIMQSLVSVNGNCFDTGEEDEDLRTIASLKIDDVLGGEREDTEFILHPKVLVACMRIDTAFQSMSVPKVQLLLTCNLLQVSLLNQPNENVELPSLLKKFRLAENTLISQTFMVCMLERLNFHVAFHSPQNFTLTSSLDCSVKCVDFGFLNMLLLLEKTNMQSYVRVNLPQRELLANFVLDKLRVNFGPTVIHTLLSSKAHWEELLDPEPGRKRHAFISKCIVVNRTYSLLSFGQTGTTERIRLQPKECHMYSFRSDYHNQELTFFIADDETHMVEVSQSVAVPLKYDGDIMVQPIRIGDKCIMVKSKKLSSSQIYVLIKGQIEIISMVPHDLRLEFRREGKQYNDKQLLEYTVEKRGRGSFYRTVQRNSHIIMRLKFASNKSKARSGDIPLRTNKNLPWLVKVPMQNGDFVSFWVRVLRENLPDIYTDVFQPQRVLITIWPIFVISSMLATPVTATELVSCEEFQLAAEGGRHVLNVPATHMTDHEVNFQYGFTLGSCSNSSYTLTLKNMEWHKFFYYNEQRWSCQHAVEEMGKGIRVYWPLNDAEELRVMRQTSGIAPVDVDYNIVQEREFSCAVCLEVSPWGTFINATGHPVSITDQETCEHLNVDANCLEMMFRIETAFTVNIPNGSSWIASLPVYWEETAGKASGRHYVLPNGGRLDIIILRGTEVFKFVLEMHVENKRRILKLRSKFAVTNFTQRRLCLLSFAMDHKESANREDLCTLDATVKKRDLKPVKSQENCIGFSIEHFYDLNTRKTQRSHDTAFVYFVCVKVCDDSYLSVPIPLTLPFTRRCCSVQDGADSVPLMLALIEKDGICYLNIFEDSSPAILVSNQTDVEFIVAQTSASENSKVCATTPEYDGRHFEWYQLVPGYSQCYYTPPEMYASFPDVESTVCNLTLGLYKSNATKKTMKWSKPLRTDKTWEKFLHVPNHGDVKVIICDKHRVTRVSIYYIAQQLEFSVKDLRSRLLKPQHSLPEDEAEPAADAGSLLQSEASVSTVDEDKPLPASLPECIHFRQDCPTKTQWRVRFFVKEVVLSLHTDSKLRDDVKCEIFGLYVDDLLVAYDDDDDRRQLQLLLPNLQIDNQLYSSGKYDFPVVLCAQQLYARTPNVPQVHQLEHTYQQLRSGQLGMASFTLEFYEDELKLSSMVCRISPVRAYIEDAYLNDLLEALVECAPSQCVYRPTAYCERIELTGAQILLPRDVAAEAICIAEPLQLRSFRIEPLNVLLSVHTSVRLYIALDHSPLSFSTYERQKILTMPLRFGQSLGMHFLSGAIFGAGWVVGSLEILGSPSGLARSFSTGLRDFVSMPVRGLFRGPWGFVVGITQGSASLLRNVTAGTVNSVSKLAASVARNLDRLSLDQEHIARTEALRRSRPQGFTEGLSQGMTGLGISILGAVGGLAHHTLEARSPVEVMTGVGKGLVGAFTKPISGAAELVALAGQGMLHTVGFNAMPQQRAPTICHIVADAPAGYRIWRLLPKELVSDQILAYYEVTLVMEEQLRTAYIFLTSTVLAIMESQWDKLTLAVPVDKLELIADREDKTLIYVRMIKEPEDVEEDTTSYTNERIMHFLHTSTSRKSAPAMTMDSLDDLLQAQSEHSKTDWAFYINEHLGEHLIQYLNIISKRIS